MHPSLSEARSTGHIGVPAACCTWPVTRLTQCQPFMMPSICMVGVQVGSALFTVVVITVHLELASMLEFWTWLHHIAIWGSIGGP